MVLNNFNKRLRSILKFTKKSNVYFKKPDFPKFDIYQPILWCSQVTEDILYIDRLIQTLKIVSKRNQKTMRKVH